MNEQRRLCPRCGQTKGIRCFSLSSQTGRQGYCRKCDGSYHREYYLKNRPKYLERNRVYKERLMQVMREAKNQPCADCGQSYPYYVMDFDHREGETKLFNVGSVASQRHLSLRWLLAEIAKCDVVCANCHRERTHQRNCRKKSAAAETAE